MDWTYRDRPIAPEDVAGFAGIVYLITHPSTGRYYVGQKRLLSRRSKPPLKGKKRRRRTVVESDWRTYWGSCEELHADLARFGHEQFTREVLFLCRSKGEMNWLELRVQVLREVLLDPLSYNSFVGGKIHRSHLRNFSEKRIAPV